MRILFVHGRSQGGKSASILRKEWLPAFQAGIAAAHGVLPDDLRTDFPFYGLKLDEFVASASLPSDAAIAKGPGDDEFGRFAGEIAEELRQRKGISDTEIRAEIVSRHGDVPTEKGVQHWEWVQAIIALLDRSCPSASSAVFSQWLRDVFLYTRRPVVRKEIDAIVAAALTDEPTVVVGHSLGSVVAYNVLCANSHANIRAFITLGSPLGIRGIRETLGILKNPGGPGGWFNAYDPRDVVALNPLDDDSFRVVPAIRNRDDVENTTENHHGITSYLDKAVVAQEIIGGLG